MEKGEKGLVRILHLEDSIPDSQLVQSILKRDHFDVEYLLTDSEEEFQACLERGTIDLILSDYHLPDYSGSEALLFAKTNFPTIPFVFLSGTMGEDVAIDSLLNGATDYVLKNKMERLVPALKRALKESRVQQARLAAEKALLQSEENFRQSLSESPLGIRIVNVAGDTIYANKAFLDIYEFSNLEEYKNTPAIERYTPESYLQHLERKSMRKNGLDILEYELDIVRKNKEIRYVRILRNEVLWNGEKHFQVINQDITEQRKLTIDLIAAKEKAEESDRLKSAFLANMSHEIRTPMNGILGFASLLKEPNLSGNEQQTYLKIIEKSGLRMLDIISEIIDISKIEAGLMKTELKETEINRQMESVQNLFYQEAESRNIRFSCLPGLPHEKVFLMTDEGKFFSILTNLVKNSLKYTDSGSIEFGYEMVETRQVVVETRHAVVETRHALSLQEPHLQFYVKDTGIGIPKDRQAAIFERFVQADIEDKKAMQGAGLGLSIAKSYVEMLGGKIWLESEEGTGTTFYFSLPYNPKNPAIETIKNDSPDEIVEYPINPVVPKLKVLIVEDDETSEIFLSILTKSFGEVILKACSGVEAINICRNNPDLDLILMDIRMPEMGGYEATRHIRQFNEKVIIIAQTAYGLSGDREKAMEAGCNDYISKPINKLQLIELVNKYCKK